jgi:hypothetical protein
MIRLMTEETLERWDAAAKIIEYDGVGGYWTCRQRYGEDIANVLIVAHLRQTLNPEGQYPAGEHVFAEMEKILKQEGLMK